MSSCGEFMNDQEIQNRFDEGKKSFEEIRTRLERITEQLEVIPQLKEDIYEARQNSEKTKEIIEAWNAIKTGGKFVRWIAPIIGGMTGAWVALKTGFFAVFR